MHHVASSQWGQTPSTSAVVAHIFFLLIMGKEVRKLEYHNTYFSLLLAGLISRLQQQTPPLHVCFMEKRYFMRLSVCRENRNAHNADRVERKLKNPLVNKLRFNHFILNCCISGSFVFTAILALLQTESVCSTGILLVWHAHVVR